MAESHALLPLALLRVLVVFGKTDSAGCVLLMHLPMSFLSPSNPVTGMGKKTSERSWYQMPLLPKSLGIECILDCPLEADVELS